MGKRCEKGKPCGATCIEDLKICRVGLPVVMGSSIKQTRDAVKSASKSLPYSVKPPTTETLGDVPYWGMTNLGEIKNVTRDILNSLKLETGVIKTSGLVKEGDVNWASSLDSGVRFVGKGSFGGFATVPADKLIRDGSNKFPNGVGVKSGNLGLDEVKVLSALKGSDLSPQLLGARESPKIEVDAYGFEVRKGVVAMSKVPGSKFSDLSGKVSGKDSSDIYWETLANLHRKGVAHNDVHGGNMYIDSTGKGRFVDFGLSQLSAKAALAEALGSMNGSNYQFEGATQYGLGKIATSNLVKVRDALRDKGLDTGEINSILKAGIRNPYSLYNTGAWGKISDKDAKQLIDIFYDGIG